MISLNTNIFTINADRSSAASREGGSQLGSCVQRRERQQATGRPTWLRVGVVHSVSVELQQLLRFGFFLPVAAHSKRILTNLKEITKLRWHWVTTARQSELLMNVFYGDWGVWGHFSGHCWRDTLNFYHAFSKHSLTIPCRGRHLIPRIGAYRGLISSRRGSATL